MSKASLIEPWKKICTLREEIRNRQLSASDFAVDLHKVIHSTAKEKPFYCDPEQFFRTTYATQNLRQFCKLVLRRLAAEPGGEAIINVAQTFGGGKSHSLTALFYLTTLGSKLPKKETSLGMILNEAQLKAAPLARVAAVSFDKVDWVTGGEVKSPEGKIRSFRMPWNLIAWQLLGQQGLDILQRDETKPDYDTPPSDTLWAKILQEVEKTGQGALILIDEFLMWAHDAASSDPTGQSKERGPVWYDRLKNFFQKLGQAVESSERSCLVVSLLATEPEKNDDVGKAILSACDNGLNRQATQQSPVEKDDVAELLRRRLFESYPENETDRHKHVLSFWPRLQAVEPTRAKLPDSEVRMKKSYPFHPDLVDRFFGKWTGLDKFQRTRGVLQTFATALRDAEAWDPSPLIGAQIFLPPPGQQALSEALRKLTSDAMNSDRARKPDWPHNLETELPRALNAQKAEAATLSGREIEAACVASFIFSQPIGEQAELSELRWLLGATCELPAVLNAGLIAWSKNSWYLEDCDTTEAVTGVSKFWRLGPKPNLNQLHDSYKRNALKHARGRFDALADDCKPLYEGCLEEGVKPHKLPSDPSLVEDDGTFRLVVLGAEYAGIPGTAPNPKAVGFLTSASSGGKSRIYQNIVLVATPSVAGLQQAEQQIADWMAWEEIRGSSQYRELESYQQETVKKREKEAKQSAQTAVRNAYELVLYLHSDGTIQAKKITMGAESLFRTLLNEKSLRLFKDKIDAEALMPGGPYSVWPGTDPSVRISELYKSFGQVPQMPKLLSHKTVLNTIEDAVRRGVLAVRYVRPGGGEQWFWRSSIEGVAEWEKYSEAWLPGQSTLNALSPFAILPGSLPGLWPNGDVGVKLSVLCSWFDGAHAFEEITQPGYPPEGRSIPKADYKLVHQAVARAVSEGQLWLVLGNDSVFKETPSALQLDADAVLLRPPRAIGAIDLLPAALPDAWTAKEPQKTTVETLYTEFKKKEGRPWPPTLFIEGINSGLGQGVFKRAEGTGALTSVAQDAGVQLVIKTDAPLPKPLPVPAAGRISTSTVTLGVPDVQTLGEEIAKLNKSLAGCDPQIEVRLTIKANPGKDLGEADKILEKIKSGWKF